MGMATRGCRGPDAARCVRTGRQDLLPCPLSPKQVDLWAEVGHTRRMSEAPLPQNETERIGALHALLGDRGVDEKSLERFTRIARTLAGMPVAAVSLVDTDRQLFRGCAGDWVRETPRAVSFCAHAILESEHLYIPDARLDPRFADNPIVTDEPRIRFYAGFPLFVHDGLAMGTMCVIDFHPRVLAPDQLASLRDLADCLQRELLLQFLLGQEPAPLWSR